MATSAVESDIDVELSQLVSSLTVSSSYDHKLQLFQFLQEHHLRRPDLIIQHGRDLLTKYKSKLGDQYWSIQERVFQAALDTDNDKIAQESLTILRKQFPTSLRVKRLLGMYEEYHQRWEQANTIYEEILTTDPTHVSSLKRKIAVCRARSQWDSCIEQLQSYLQLFSQDENAWVELAGIYVQQTKFELAKFCYEELLLLSPENYLYHILLADVLFTLDSKDKSSARHYYIQSLELKPDNNLRALYGAILCLRHQRDTSNTLLYDDIRDRILAHYKGNPELAAIVKEAITQ